MTKLEVLRLLESRGADILSQCDKYKQQGLNYEQIAAANPFLAGQAHMLTMLSLDIFIHS